MTDRNYGYRALSVCYGIFSQTKEGCHFKENKWQCLTPMINLQQKLEFGKTYIWHHESDKLWWLRSYVPIFLDPVLLKRRGFVSYPLIVGSAISTE